MVGGGETVRLIKDLYDRILAKTKSFYGPHLYTAFDIMISPGMQPWIGHLQLQIARRATTSRKSPPKNFNFQTTLPSVN
jgi:hypothetical protein